ncbi:hypothetical protein IWZ01DRAFT_177383 [Phyllosticta capitalensis]
MYNNALPVRPARDDGFLGRLASLRYLLALALLLIFSPWPPRSLFDMASSWLSFSFFSFPDLVASINYVDTLRVGRWDGSMGWAETVGMDGIHARSGRTIDMELQNCGLEGLSRRP